MGDRIRIFEEQRPRLQGIAYRMLGSVADANDIVQDTWLKWQEADPHSIRDPRAWLATVCSRLSLNVLKSARGRRELYVGTWLPEPFPDDTRPDPAHAAQVDETVSIALMLALERLSPVERAAFILNEVFGYRFDEVALILEKSAAACRQLASRARKRLRSDKPRFAASDAEHRQLLDSFWQASRTGELDPLRSLLVESVELWSDGGGKAEAVHTVLRGADAVARFFAAIGRKQTISDTSIQILPTRFNGRPGLLIHEDGTLTTAISIDVHDGRITRIYGHRNPEKLNAFGDGKRIA